MDDVEAVIEEENDKVVDFEENGNLGAEQLPFAKPDADSTSAVTYNSDCASSFSYLRNPSVANSVASSKLELQLNFLAKELELERQRR